MTRDSRGHPMQQGTHRTSAPEGETTEAQAPAWARSSKERISPTAAKGAPLATCATPAPRSPAASKRLWLEQVLEKEGCSYGRRPVSSSSEALGANTASTVPVGTALAGQHGTGLRASAELGTRRHAAAGRERVSRGRLLLAGPQAGPQNRPGTEQGGPSGHCREARERTQKTTDSARGQANEPNGIQAHGSAG